MNPAPSIDDVMLMSWADGQADAATSQLVERAIAQDPELARRAAAMTTTRAYLQQLRVEHPAAQVPDRLLQSVQAMVDRHERMAAATVPEPAPAAVRPSRAKTSGFWERFSGFSLWGIPAGPAFAGLALSLGVGLMIGQGNPSSPVASGPAAPVASVSRLPVVGDAMPSAVAQVLDRVRSGAVVELPEGGGKMAVIASFGSASDLCREFVIEPPSRARIEALACRAPDRTWSTQLVAMQPAADDRFRPATGERPIDSLLKAKGMTSPLPETQEQALGFRAME